MNADIRAGLGGVAIAAIMLVALLMGVADTEFALLTKVCAGFTAILGLAMLIKGLVAPPPQRF